MAESRVGITQLTAEDLPFLVELWHIPDVMRYADEFPKLRGWHKSMAPGAAWQAYQARRAELGASYTQLILRLNDGAAIGESFFTPLPEGYTFGRWAKPESVHALMGDIKLLPAHWGQGLGTEGMRLVAQWAFAQTPCDLLVVPPHRYNPAAERVYEKTGFVLFTGMRSWHNHKIMELTRQRFERLYAA
jgi:RimJ/RimL family protein N-acetyltransferase